MDPAHAISASHRKRDPAIGSRKTVVRAGDAPDRVYAAIRRDIIERRLPAGTKLPEGDIAQRSGVSRTVVRAAFARLIAEGLVVRQSNQNARVAKPSPDEAADILDLRRSIELIVIGRLTEGPVPDEILATLRAHVAEEERALSEGGAESIRLSGEFHVRLAEAAGSPLLARYVSELVSRCSLLLSDQHLPHSGQCAVQEHQALIDSLARGDAEATLTQMDHHLSAVGERATFQTSRRRVLLCRAVPGSAASLPEAPSGA
jgi:DNA-binding GntR family transcriptional regulator